MLLKITDRLLWIIWHWSLSVGTLHIHPLCLIVCISMHIPQRPRHPRLYHALSIRVGRHCCSMNRAPCCQCSCQGFQRRHCCCLPFFALCLAGLGLQGELCPPKGGTVGSINKLRRGTFRMTPFQMPLLIAIILKNCSLGTPHQAATAAMNVGIAQGVESSLCIICIVKVHLDSMSTGNASYCCVFLQLLKPLPLTSTKATKSWTQWLLSQGT